MKKCMKEYQQYVINGKQKLKKSLIIKDDNILLRILLGTI